MVSRPLLHSLQPLLLSLLGLLAVGSSMGSRAAYSNPTPTDYQGQLKRWAITIANPDITYRIITEGGGAAEHIAFTQRAAEQWSEAEDSYINLVRIDDDGEGEQITITLTDQFSGHSRSGGFAIFDRWGDAGPEHCRIEVPIVFPMRSGFPRTVLHEIGHCIGLGHSLVPESVMSYDLKASGFNLAVSDLAGAAMLYPADGSPPTPPLSCGVIHGRHASLGISVGTGVLAACHLIILLFGLGGLKNQSKNPRLAQRRDEDS